MCSFGMVRALSQQGISKEARSVGRIKAGNYFRGGLGFLCKSVIKSACAGHLTLHGGQP